MLTMLVCTTYWLFMHLYTLVYMFMHESCLLVCCPYFNTMKLWTSDPNLHLSPHGHHLLFAFFLVCLFTCFPICLPSSSLAYLVACHVSCHMLCLLLLYACLLYAHCALSTHLFLSIACLLVFCLYLCIDTHGVRTHGAMAWSPRHKQKGRRCKHVDMSQAAMFSIFRGLASPIWLCTLLSPFSSSPPPLPFSLRRVVLGISCHVPFILTSKVWQPLFTFLHLYFEPCSRDVGIYFPTLCACIVHDVCIDILARPF